MVCKRRMSRHFVNLTTIVFVIYFFLFYVFFYNKQGLIQHHADEDNEHLVQNGIQEDTMTVMMEPPLRQQQAQVQQIPVNLPESPELQRISTNNISEKVEDIMDRILKAKKEFPTDEKVDMIRDTSKYRGCDEYRHAASIKRLVIPDILEHGQFNPEDAEQVSLIAHMTEDRLPRFEMLLQQWNGPISIALYLKMENTRSVVETVLGMSGLVDRNNILLHVVPENGLIYPVNYLRNVAINNTRTRYIFLTDIDFLPGLGTHNILLDELQYFRSKNHGKVVFVVAAFEEATTEEYLFPADQQDAKELWDSGIIKPFHLDKFPSGHHRTNFKEWGKGRTMSYKIKWEPLFEPYIAGERTALPLYSQTFVGRGMNKIQQIVEVVAMGFEMRVIPGIFVIHISHERSRSHSQDQFASCSAKVMKEFNKYILKKYDFSGQ